MSCRHKAGDPSCSSSSNYVAPARTKSAPPTTPDAEKYTIEDVERVGNHLALKVKYPNCRDCAFEGTKVMVFLNVTESQAIRWRRIDPHFRAPPTRMTPVPRAEEAPSPAARFPATVDGWQDALSYARTKSVTGRGARDGGPG